MTTLYGAKVYKTNIKSTTFTTLEEYKGFAIQGMTRVYRTYDRIMGGYIDMGSMNKTKTHILVCKKGNEGSYKKCLEYYVRTIEEAKKFIDEFTEGKVYSLTYKDYDKYVGDPNKKCEWAFSNEDLKAFLEKYKKGSLRTRYIITERLTDANFHAECSLLMDGKYDEYEKLIAA